MGENAYRTLGAVYVIIGILSISFFLSDELVRYFLFERRHYVFYYYIFTFVLPLVMLVGSFILALFGIILVVRSDVWVARVSGVLCSISLSSLFYSFVIHLLFWGGH